MVVHVKRIHILVHPKFYNKLEQQRREVEKQLKVKVTYPEFTDILGNSNFKFPKLKLRGLYAKKER